MIRFLIFFSLAILSSYVSAYTVETIVIDGVVYHCITDRGITSCKKVN